MNKKTPFFSIVIPTLNEESYLPRLLQNITDQTFPLELVEVIHVDGHSDDKTVELAQKFSKQLSITSHVVDKRNVSHQRNFGASKARGECVIFFDADSQIPTYFLDGLKYQLGVAREISVFSTLVKVDSADSADLAIEKSINLGLLLMNLSRMKGAFGACIGAKAEVVKKIQFDETQNVYEDAFFIQAAVKEGFRFKIFNEPRYIFSLRRIKKEGLLKMARSIALLNLRYISGKDFRGVDYGYVMEGGEYYQEGKDKQRIFASLTAYLKSASKKQLQRTQKLLRSI